MKKLFVLIPVLFLLVLPAHAEDYIPIGSPEELAAIAASSADSFALLTEKEPIVAMATRNQGCFLPPRKKPWLSVFLPASQDTVKSIMK